MAFPFLELRNEIISRLETAAPALTGHVKNVRARFGKESIKTLVTGLPWAGVAFISSAVPLKGQEQAWHIENGMFTVYLTVESAVADSAAKYDDCLLLMKVLVDAAAAIIGADKGIQINGSPFGFFYSGMREIDYQNGILMYALNFTADGPVLN